ncbi:MAG: carboxypeptidase regulatory-like domain-containing protein [Planctomycetota bacterium]|nr:carboxypeptidase regulatory-like domain-containing protein [Planctomycetota bacterium]
MKSKPTIAVSLVVALAAAVWAISAPRTAPSPESAAASSPASASTAQADPRAVSGERGPGPGRDAGAAPPVSERTEVVAPERRAARPARVTGRIVDGDAAPMPALTFVVVSWRGREAFGASTPWRSADTQRRKVVTDDEGRFSFELGVERSAYLWIKDDALVFSSPVRMTGAGVDQDLGDLVVAVAASVAGVVQDAAGRPVAGVRVAAEQGLMGSDEGPVTSSREDGSFVLTKLPPGTWTLRARSSEWLPVAVEQEVAAGQQVTGLLFTLSPGATITGRVVDDRGVGVVDIPVTRQRAERSGALEVVRFSDDEAVMTGEGGSFRIAGLDGGSVTLKVSGPGHATKVQSFDLDASPVQLQVDRLGAISGVLVDGAGAAISGSRVRAVAETRGASALLSEVAGFELQDLGRGIAMTDAQGRFEILDVTPGVVRVEATGDAHLPAERRGLSVQPGAHLDGVKLIAASGATVVVEVVDEAGEPVVGAEVEVTRAPRPQAPGMRIESRVESRSEGGDLDGVVVADRRQLGRGVTDTDGVAKISGLPRADAVLKVSHARFASPPPPSLTLTASGAVSQRVVMLKPGFVDVTVVRADGAAAAGTSVELEAIDASGPSEVERGKADADGKVRFGPLPAGRYTAVLARAPEPRQAGSMMMFVGGSERLDSSAKEVAVAAGAAAAVTLELPVLARVSGRVFGVDGVMSGVVVELENADDDEEVLGFGGRRVTTGGDGAYSFTDVEAGRYEVRYAKPGAIVKAKLELDVPVNATELRQDLALRTGSVRVAVVTQEDAEPVERAEVRLERQVAADPSGKPRRAQRVMMVSVVSDGEGESTSTMTLGNERMVTDEDGVAVFEDVPVGTYTLEVESRKYAPSERADVEVVERQVTDLGTVEVAPAGQVRGVVEDQSGERVMSMVEHRLQGDENWRAPEMAMQGSYRLRGLAPGRYEVRARAIGAQVGEPSAPVLVEVVAGKTKVSDLVVTR